jgi:glyoxylase-like metal-dependent hydrolase (beta-lactamase superfamily II)
MVARIDRVVVRSNRSAELNVWLLGDAERVLVIDAAHDADAIRSAIGDRSVVGIVCTHGHEAHINQAPTLSEVTGAAIMLHPADLELWRTVFPDRIPDEDLVDGEKLEFPQVEARVLHTPEHTPGSCCLYVPAIEAVFTGDTRPAHLRLETLPPQTRAYPGHGGITRIHPVRGSPRC